MKRLTYDEVVEIQGIKIPFVREIITPRIERHIRNGNYEIGECQAARKWLQAGDRVLELGAGIGLVAAIAAKQEGIEKIVSIEANPRLIDLINETHRINGIERVELRNGVVSNFSQSLATFYLRKHFWASSLDKAAEPFDEEVEMPNFTLASLISEIEPTVIMADIEGAEIDVFEDADLSQVRTILIELHPGVYGREGQQKILKNLDSQGFRAEQEYVPGSVWVLTRKPKHPAPRIYTSGPTTAEHPTTSPRCVIPTCMKDEGPYLLEWIAYHKSIGIDEFVVFTNDCSDGTDLMLDRLDEMGIVTHLPNPAIVAGSTYFQPFAMKYAMTMPQVRRADYVIQTDVDEFINIHAGEGHFRDVLAAAGPFHVLSMSEVNFSSAGHWAFRDGWVTELFQEHETKEPGHWQARRGVKSIIHGLENFEGWPVHRPVVHPSAYQDLLWLDGSGANMPEPFVAKRENGIDRRGRYDLVQLDHHPLKSAQSFLLKKVRGDVVTETNSVDRTYYRKRALGGKSEKQIARRLAGARQVWEQLIADKRLAALHAEAVATHHEMIAKWEHHPELDELRTWMKESYFQS